MKTFERMKTYERPDRDALANLTDGLQDLVSFSETHLLMERYGLSLAFNDKSLEWRCDDPDGLFTFSAYTPAGAVYGWDCKRQEVQGEDDVPEPHVVPRP